MCDHCHSEADTRALHIDPELKKAGWGVVEGSRIRRSYTIAPGRIEGQGRRGNPLYADYVLEYRNIKLGVIEAKSWDQSITEGLGQAKNYATKMAVRFAYSSNGQGQYGCDMQTGKERDLERYPRRMNSGTWRLPKQTHGVIGSLPFLIRTRAAHGPSASIRRRPFNACWRPSRMAKTACS